MPLLTMIFGLFVVMLGIAPQVRGQPTVPPGSTLDSSNTVDAADSAVLFGATDYAIPHARFDWRMPPHLRTCQRLFQDSVFLANPKSEHFVLPTTTVYRSDTPWNPVPDGVVTYVRSCLRTLNTDQLPWNDWPLVLRLAVGVSDDALVHAIVTRQLAWVDTMPGLLDTARTRLKAQVLDTVVSFLWQNRWNNNETSYRTPGHDSLARAFAAQLDTMRPSGMLFATRLRIFDMFNAPNLLHEGDSAGDIAAQRAVVQQRAQLARSVDASTASAADRATIQDVIEGERVDLTWLDYLQTPTHATFSAYLTARGPRSNEIIQLQGHPVPPLHGDYWFHLPVNSAAPGAPTMPAPGVVSLLVFLNAREGRLLTQTPFDSNEVRRITRLQRLHAQFPQLQIILVTMTTGRFQDQDDRAHPEQEAEQLQHYVSDELHIPGIVCVIRTQYHTEDGGTAVPLASPALDAYHLDPRHYDNGVNQFLVDQGGWIVATARGEAQGVIPRLFGRATGP